MEKLHKLFLWLLLIIWWPSSSVWTSLLSMMQGT